MSEAAAQTAKSLWTRRIPSPGVVVPAAGGFAAVVGLAVDQGGYFPPAWGWSAFTFSLVAAIGLVVRDRLRLGGLELTMLAGVVALTGWIALSTVWSTNAPQSVLEAERAVVYVAAILAALVVVRRRSVPSLLGGMLAGVVVIAIYALHSRLFPRGVIITDPISGYRLTKPLGYWNALGALAGFGIVLAVGFAARGRGWLRPLASASLVVLLPTAYFTFSRGAVLATAVGVAFMVLVDRGRLQLLSTMLVAAPAPALAVWLAARSPGLTDQHTTLQRALHDGHRLAPLIAVLAGGSAVLMALFAAAEARLRFSRSVRVVYASLLVGLLVAATLVASARYGGPVTLSRKAYRTVTAPETHVTGNLNGRFVTLSDPNRISAWRAAWADYGQNPLLGSGAGSFEQYWLKHRPNSADLTEVHNLYLETLAELGPIGLALLVIALSLPLVGASRARAEPLTAAAFGAYAACLAHAALDLDWEMPALTVTALLLGVALIISGRRRSEDRSVSATQRSLGLAVTLGIACFAVVGFIGNNALAGSRSAFTAQDWARAESLARKAIRWAPWSADAWFALGKAQSGAGDPAAARRSFEQAIRKNPREWATWYSLGTVSVGQAQRRAYEQAARLNPLSDTITQLRGVGLLPRH